jgi:proteasome lid subunit RPN8/RPN11
MLELSQTHLDQIIAHARQTSPEECCGMLVGRLENDRAVVAAIEPSANTWDGDRRTRFMIDPRMQLRVQRESREVGLDIVGYYHSHPTSPPVPSQFDRDLAWPGHSYLILSLLTDPPELRAWRIEDENATFQPEECKVTGTIPKTP